MIHPELLNDAALKKLLRVYPENACLFKQGDKGNTMFIIIEGHVQLTQKTMSTVRMVDVVGPGEMLGEKAILSDQPYKRGLTAIAKSEVALLEFDQKNLQVIQTRMPNFIIMLLRMVTQRLDRANEIVNILQLHDSAEKIAQYLMFFARLNGTKVAQGVQFRLTTAQIHSNLNVPDTYIKEFIDVMVKNGVLLIKGEDFVLTDDQKLIGCLTLVKERAAA